MTTEPNLTDIINDVLNTMEPEGSTIENEAEADTSVETEVEETDLESEETDTEDLEVEEGESEADEDSVEEEIEDGDEEEDVVDDDSIYTVKVDGEEVSVTLDELKAGYSRQAHFTRSMQALKEEREAFEAERQTQSETIEAIQQLDVAWENNPVDVLTQLTISTGNAAHTLGMLIRELAVQDQLPAEALEYFGIDNATKQGWAQESEVNQLRKEREELEKLRETERKAKEEQAQNAQVQEAIRFFENQITEIISDEGIKFKTSTDRERFKTELLGYARDNQIMDLKKAYAALSYELQRAEKVSAAKAAKTSSKKTATKVVSRRGAGMGGVSDIQDNTDLRSVIEQTMRELGK
jgi:hypothetical protein